MFSRRFWKAVSSYHRQVRQAAIEYDACFERFRASRSAVTREAYHEFRLEYELAASELRTAVAELRAFHSRQLSYLERRRSPQRREPDLGDASSA
jgi:histidinol dehydrogenase